ncbi:transposase InsO family protein [Cupriavidus necator]|nr:transposase InsO family protein [Cupriavidus necator]
MATLLKVAALPASTFYYQRKVLQSGDKNQHLKARIRHVFEAHKGRYGYRRVTEELRSQGWLVNHKPVQRLMQELGLKSCVRVKKYRSYRGECGRAAPNVLDRQFEAQRPNQKWATDVTEFKVAGQKLYLSPVLDLCTGEIIAYETARRPHFELVTNMLHKAFARLGPDDRPLLHSDQGWHYRMPGYQRLLAQHVIEQSMSRKGNCLDNAAMESFFGTLKAEFFHIGRFHSIAELEAGLHRYIHYYNHERIKLKLKGLSPARYRAQFSSI